MNSGYWHILASGAALGVVALVLIQWAVAIVVWRRGKKKRIATRRKQLDRVERL